MGSPIIRGRERIERGPLARRREAALWAKRSSARAKIPWLTRQRRMRLSGSGRTPSLPASASAVSGASPSASATPSSAATCKQRDAQ